MSTIPPGFPPAENVVPPGQIDLTGTENFPAGRHFWVGAAGFPLTYAGTGLLLKFRRPGGIPGGIGSIYPGGIPGGIKSWSRRDSRRDEVGIVLYSNELPLRQIFLFSAAKQSEAFEMADARSLLANWLWLVVTRCD